MKRIAFALVAVGLGLSSSAFAAGAAVPENGTISAGTGAGNCELLSENIKVNLSAGVSAAFNCSVPSNTITVGTCHNAGSRNPSLTCTQIGTDPDTNDPIWNDDSCNEAGAVIEGSSPDFRGFFGQTSGGSIGPAFLGGTCSSATLAGHAKLGD